MFLAQLLVATANDEIYAMAPLNGEGKVLPFHSLKGKVIYITNVASYCGRTEQHYKEMEQLQDKYGDRGLEIVAFPCNQFGAQEPASNREIKSFVEGYNFKGTLMGKVDVNGPQTAPIYSLLKKATHTEEITWNFGTIFLVSPEGNIERHDDRHPLALEEDISAMLMKGEL
jgi:glutathione peroxidase